MQKNFHPANFSLIRGNNNKITWSQVGTVQKMGQNLDVLPLQEGHSDLVFVGFVQLWNPFFSGTTDDIILHG